MKGLRANPLYADQRMPLLVQPDSAGSLPIEENRAALGDRLREHGALLFRDFQISGVADFVRLLDSLGGQRMDYVQRSTPRTELQDRVFTATEYPAHQEI